MIFHIKGRTPTEGVQTRMPGRIYRHKGEKITGGRTKLHKEKHNLHL
jgi:hypothetical protein